MSTPRNARPPVLLAGDATGFSSKHTSRTAVAASAILGKLASLFGYTFGVIMLLALLRVSSGHTEVAAVLLVFLLLCVLAVVKGARVKKRIRRFRNYVSLISGAHITSLHGIAGSTWQSVDFVRADMQKMIDKGFFVGVAIDRNTDELIIGGQRGQAAAPPPIPSPSAVPPVKSAGPSGNESFTCTGCGAAGTKRKGASAECEYCGTWTE